MLCTGPAVFPDTEATASFDFTQPEASVQPGGVQTPSCGAGVDGIPQVDAWLTPVHTRGAPVSELSLLPWLSGSRKPPPHLDPRTKGRGLLSSIPPGKSQGPSMLWLPIPASPLGILLGPGCLCSLLPGRGREATVQSQWVFVLA